MQMTTGGFTVGEKLNEQTKGIVIYDGKVQNSARSLFPALRYHNLQVVLIQYK